jgi:hypothetical protein
MNIRANEHCLRLGNCRNLSRRNRPSALLCTQQSLSLSLPVCQDFNGTTLAREVFDMGAASHWAQMLPHPSFAPPPLTCFHEFTVKTDLPGKQSINQHLCVIALLKLQLQMKTEPRSSLPPPPSKRATSSGFSKLYVHTCVSCKTDLYHGRTYAHFRLPNAGLLPALLHSVSVKQVLPVTGRGSP